MVIRVRPCNSWLPAAFFRMKLVVIEDQTMIRQLLVMACKLAVPGAEVFGAADGVSGVALCQKERPDLVTLDLVLPDCDGLDLVPAIRAASGQAKILVLSACIDEFTLHRLQKAGVNGCIDKSSQNLNILKQAIKALFRGETYHCSFIERLTARMKADPVSFAKVLSLREVELLPLFGHSWSNEEVARELGLSPKTVRNHRQNIMKKLGFSSTRQLIRYALDKGFVRAGDRRILGLLC